MKTFLNLKHLMSFVLICSTTLLMSQEKEKASIADVVYKDYKEKGIDSALERYAKLKEKEAATYKIDEWELNRIGYKIMHEDQDLEAAEKVFSLNIKEYPEAANPNDSYADYLIVAGNEEEAKKYLKKSISMTKQGKGTLDDTRLYQGSLGKLARLENRHAQLDFLVGEWDLDLKNMNNGKVVSQNKEINKIHYDEEHGILTADFIGPDGTPFAKRVLAYDAVDDEFDVVYIGSNQMLGLWPSTIKVKDLGNDAYEAIEEYTDDNKEQVSLRHEIRKIDENTLEWNIFNEAEGGQVASMNFKRRQ